MQSCCLLQQQLLWCGCYGRYVGAGTRSVLADVLVKIMRCLANFALSPTLRAQVARHADMSCIIDVLGGALPSPEYRSSVMDSLCRASSPLQNTICLFVFSHPFALRALQVTRNMPSTHPLVYNAIMQCVGTKNDALRNKNKTLLPCHYHRIVVLFYSSSSSTD